MSGVQRNVFPSGPTVLDYYNISTNGTCQIGDNSNNLLTNFSPIYDTAQLAVKGNINCVGVNSSPNGASTGTYYSNSVSAIKIPADSSNNRPTGQIGYIRYNTDVNTVEFWSGLSNSWQPISPLTPIISSISPQYVAQKNTSITYTISGSNFNTFSSVYFVGSIDNITYPTASTTYINSSQLTSLITSTIADASINTSFYIKVINTDSGTNSLSSFTISFNKGPVWNSVIGSTRGNTPTLTIYTTSNSPFIDLSASDISVPPDLPITYYSTSGLPANVSLDPTLGRLYGTMPTITNSTTYNFNAYAQDNAQSKGPTAAFSFTVDPKKFIYSSGQVLPTPTTDTSYSTYIFPWISSNQTTYSFTSNFVGSVEYLVVAGGGGGANGNGSGGGGGQVLIGTFDITTNNTYTVNVGNGGAAYNGAAVENRATNGYNSSLTGTSLSILALGGGAGVSFSNNLISGNYGGNGGGGPGRDNATTSYINVGGAFASVASVVAGGYSQSYSGGSGSANNSYNAGGGGGGGGGPGSAASTVANVNNNGGNGGSGVSSSLSGTLLFYGAGGGGGAGGLPGPPPANQGGIGGTGGSGIGGNGGANSYSGQTDATAPTAGRGAGGGGAGQGNATAGSSGVVILRFPTEARLFFKTSGYLGWCNTNSFVTFTNAIALSTVYGLTPQPTITYALTNFLPSGLNLNTSTGVISGTANINVTSLSNFSITASATGYSSVTQNFSIGTYYYTNASLLLGFNNNTNNSGTTATTWSVTSSPNLTYSSSIFRYGGYSGSFNGTSTQIIINTASAPGNNAAFVIALWLNLTAHNPFGRTYLVDLRNNSPDVSGYWLIDSNNTMTFTYSTSGSSALVEITIPYFPSYGQWEHLVWVTKDSTTNFPTIYRNGKPIYIGTVTTGCSWNDLTSHIGTFWNSSTNSNYWLNGYIDNLMIYRGSFASTAVQSIYENVISY